MNETQISEIKKRLSRMTCTGRHRYQNHVKIPEGYVAHLDKFEVIGGIVYVRKQQTEIQVKDLGLNLDTVSVKDVIEATKKTARRRATAKETEDYHAADDRLTKFRYKAWLTSQKYLLTYHRKLLDAAKREASKVERLEKQLLETESKFNKAQAQFERVWPTS